MKKLAFIVFSLLQFASIHAQKYDFNWIFGYEFFDQWEDTTEGINFLQFDSPSGNPYVVFNKYVQNDFHYYGSIISDQNGKYLFSFDGYNVEDYRYKYITNSRKVCPDSDCEFLQQGSFIVPAPGFDSLYYLFNQQEEIIPVTDSTSTVIANIINYNTLSALPNTKGVELQMIKKPLLNDSFDLGKISACKHANGRDWWFVLPGRFNNKFYVFLLAKNKVELFNIQDVGKKRNFGLGWSCFSQNAKYYVITTKDDVSLSSGSEFDFYHFNRVTGILSNHKNFFIDSTESVGAGCAFSPDNKLLYICSAGALYQYAIENDTLKDRIEIAKYDGFLSHLFDNVYGMTFFGDLQNGPDGRIYCNSDFLQTKHMHVINKPNERGLACDFRQHSIPFISVKINMPHFPNYRLGPIGGSVADSLGIENIPWCWWRYGQDTSNHLKIEFTDASSYEPKEWQWDFGDGNTSTETNPMHIYKKNGIYEVCLIIKNTNGTDTLCRTLHLGTVDIQSESTKSIKYKIFPNPFRDFILIQIEHYLPEKMYAIIQNMEGKEMGRLRLYEGINNYSLVHLPPGEYIVNLVENHKTLGSKVLIKK